MLTQKVYFRVSRAWRLSRENVNPNSLAMFFLCTPALQLSGAEFPIQQRIFCEPELEEFSCAQVFLETVPIKTRYLPFSLQSLVSLLSHHYRYSSGHWGDSRVRGSRGAALEEEVLPAWRPQLEDRELVCPPLQPFTRLPGAAWSSLRGRISSLVWAARRAGDLRRSRPGAARRWCTPKREPAVA